MVTKQPHTCPRALFGKTRRLAVLSLSLLLLALLWTSRAPGAAGASSSGGSDARRDAAAAKPSLADRYGKLPLVFEENRGQADRRVRFVSRGEGYSLFLTGNEAVLRLRGEDCAPRADEAPAVDGGAAVGNDEGDAGGNPLCTPGASSAVLRLGLEGAARAARERRGAAGGREQLLRRRGARLAHARPAVRAGQVRVGLSRCRSRLLRQPARAGIRLPSSHPALTPRPSPCVPGRDSATPLTARRPAAPPPSPVLCASAARSSTRSKTDGAQAEGDGATRSRERAGACPFRLGDHDRARPLVIDPVLSGGSLGGRTPTHPSRRRGYRRPRLRHGLTTTRLDCPAGGALHPANGDCNDAFVVKLNPAGRRSSTHLPRRQRRRLQPRRRRGRRPATLRGGLRRPRAVSRRRPVVVPEGARSGVGRRLPGEAQPRRGRGSSTQPSSAAAGERSRSASSRWTRRGAAYVAGPHRLAHFIRARSPGIRTRVGQSRL